MFLFFIFDVVVVVVVVNLLDLAHGKRLLLLTHLSRHDLYLRFKCDDFEPVALHVSVVHCLQRQLIASFSSSYVGLNA